MALEAQEWRRQSCKPSSTSHTFKATDTNAPVFWWTGRRCSDSEATAFCLNIKPLLITLRQMTSSITIGIVVNVTSLLFFLTPIYCLRNIAQYTVWEVQHTVWGLGCVEPSRVQGERAGRSPSQSILSFPCLRETPPSLGFRKDCHTENSSGTCTVRSAVFNYYQSSYSNFLSG